MAGNEYQAVRPKQHYTPDGVELRPRILAGSPLALLGIYLESLREYFSGVDAPYRWSTDANSSELIVEAGKKPTVETNNPSRGVFVRRMGSVPASIGMGDRLGVDLPSGQESFIAHMTTSFRVDCVCAAEGEAELLADFVHHFLIASRKVFARQYGLHEMSMAAMGAVEPYEFDTKYFAVALTFETTHAFRWTIVKIAPLIQQVGIRMQFRSGKDPAPGSAQEAAETPADAAFAQLALDSLTRNVPMRPGPPGTDRT